ncbi:MAG TPA: isocitrate/isopropylmalate dehydrogenase family protein [Gemmatimonadetes bacterium]|nr:isocitrate/isopropylmalate dehydrogenase family protein [Gemmatimonadota bacterium]
MPRVALIPGDGIGVEVVREARLLLEALNASERLDLELIDWDLGAERYLREGVTITDEEFASLAEYDAVLLGALGDPRVPGNEHAKDILLGMRFKLDLYVNYRPCVLLSPELSPLKNVDGPLRLEIFRENTEGAYTGMGGSFKTGTPDEIAIEEDVNTWKGVERLVRAAFDFADTRGRSRVTLVDKANAQRHAGGLWRRVFAEVGARYPAIEQDAMYVDAMAMDLIRRPQRYQVIVASNLFGDIVSDVAAEVTGGLGLAPSANIHPGRNALFEPVHGSAPDIAGRGTANPIGAIRCVSLMLDHFGRGELAARVEAAVAASIEHGRTTPDLGGQLSTAEVGKWIMEQIAGARAAST